MTKVFTVVVTDGTRPLEFNYRQMLKVLSALRVGARITITRKR